MEKMQMRKNIQDKLVEEEKQRKEKVERLKKMFTELDASNKIGLERKQDIIDKEKIAE